MKNKPPYSITSVDHALRLAHMLQQEGQLTVSEAADRLGVARSTAHRLLAMLVYRDFAVQGTDRRYRTGPVLRPAEPLPERIGMLRDLALPHMQVLVAQVNETANLMVRFGTKTRFILTVECDQALRVGNRAGVALPAHLTSGGRALLATLDAGQLAELFHGRDVDLSRLRRELGVARGRGFALNEQRTERGISAVGVALPGPGDPPAALSLAIPTTRFRRDQLTSWVSALTAAAADIDRDVAIRQPAPAAPGPTVAG